MSLEAKYKSKKAFKEDYSGKDIRHSPAYETSIFGPEIPPDGNGTICIEGGNKYVGGSLYHSWYASVTLKDHIMVSIK